MNKGFPSPLKTPMAEIIKIYFIPLQIISI